MHLSRKNDIAMLHKLLNECFIPTQKKTSINGVIYFHETIFLVVVVVVGGDKVDIFQRENQHFIQIMYWSRRQS